MALTKTIKVDKVELSNIGAIFVREVTEIKEDDVVISTSFHRHTIAPRVKTGEEVDADGNVTKAASWADTDVSSEDSWVQSVASGAWTDKVKTDYENHMDSFAT